jgi:ornithine cyclodeaminase/alanine dehydrogenase-like protein (mu-crystallin family)
VPDNNLILLTAAEVTALLDLDELVDALAAAMRDLSEGRASVPPRAAAAVEQRSGLLLAMPSYVPSTGTLAAKLVSLFPHNVDKPTHHAIVCCFDPDDGRPIALMDGEYLTAARTAAGSALSTRLLARPGAQEVAVIGTGVEALAHARAMARVPGVRTVRVAGRDPARVDSVVTELVAADVPAAAATGIEQAVRASDIVCACTHADAPVLRREWLRDGAHVTSVGYNSAGTGEVGADLIRDAVVVVESRAAALAPTPSGAVELHRAVAAGDLAAERVVEIGEVVADPSRGRAVEAQLTLYKSVGVGVQDAAAAALVLRAAAATGRGTRVVL